MRRDRCRRPAVLGTLLAFVLCAGVTPAWSWGRLAHEAICEIAYRELPAATRARLRQIMAGDPEVRTFRKGCAWPDWAGAAQDARRSEHYVNVPRSWTTIPADTCPLAPHCLLSAIRDDERVLASSASARERRRALEFLGHWVGDIHQPLHVSFEDDRGGNEIEVANHLPCRHNLHGVWDACIPEALMKRLGAGRDARRLATILRGEITDRQRAAWRRDMSPAAWASESLSIARRPDVQYCVLRGEVCRYSSDRRRHSGREDRVLHIGAAYIDAHVPVVAEQIEKAGVRLAALLEQLLGK